MYRKNYFSGYFILKEVRDLNEEFIGAIHKETPAHQGAAWRRLDNTAKLAAVSGRSEQCIPDLGESEGGGGSTSPQSLAPDTRNLKISG